MPLEEVYGVTVAQIYRWKRSLEQGLTEPSGLIPKRQVVGLQKRVEELDRALGWKALGAAC